MMHVERWIKGGMIQDKNTWASLDATSAQGLSKAKF